MGKILAIVNQKGGVGKTTVSFNLGHAFAEKGKKVLLVDFDPQSNLTMCCGFDHPGTIKTTMYHLMNATIDGSVLPPREEFIHKVDGVDLIPSSIELSALEVSLVNAMSREVMLKTILDGLKPDYEVIITDCCLRWGC